jgi:hypothetical protein
MFCCAANVKSTLFDSLSLYLYLYLYLSLYIYI